MERQWVIAVMNKTTLEEARKKIMDELDDVPPEFKFTIDGELTLSAKQEKIYNCLEIVKGEILHLKR